MKRKFFCGSIILISLALIGGCGLTNSKVNEYKKEVIVIDEMAKETIEESGNLSLNLKFQGYIKLTDEITTIDDEYEIYHFMNDNVFRITIKDYRENPMQQFGVRNILKTEMKTLKMNSKDEDLTSGTWTDINITGTLIAPGFGEIRDIKIYKDNKVFKLLDDGSLKEIEVYTEHYRIHGTEEYFNPKISVFSLGDNKGIGIIKTETNEYFEIKDQQNIEGLNDVDGRYFRIFEAEDNKIYVFNAKGDYESSELQVGYVEDNKFYNLFENEDLKIMNQEGIYVLDYDLIIKNKKDILFPGVIEDVNGIWSYNLETKKLSLQIELADDIKTGKMLVSPNKENLIIQNYDSENNPTTSLVRLSEDSKIEQIIDITEKDKFVNYDNFSEDGSKIYLEYFNEEENKRIYEIYDISN